MTNKTTEEIAREVAYELLIYIHQENGCKKCNGVGCSICLEEIKKNIFKMVFKYGEQCRREPILALVKFLEKAVPSGLEDLKDHEKVKQRVIKVFKSIAGQMRFQFNLAEENEIKP